MRRARLLTLVGVLLLATAGSARPVHADDRADARAHYEKATGAYALGRYGDAAAEFEAAFALKPDPAILYNAAQANRLAGKKERALELYRNYRRVYGRRAEHAPDVDKHIAELEKAVENDRHVASAESTDLAHVDPGAATATRESSTMPAPTMTVPAAPPPSTPAATVLVTQAAPATRDDDKPVYTRWWFWAGAGAVVAGAVVGTLLLTRKTADCGPGVDYCANTGL